MLATPPITIGAHTLAVYQNRQARVQEGEKAILVVYAKNEAAEIFNEAPRLYERTLKLVVEVAIYDHTATDLDDLLDDISDEIEQRVFRNEYLDDLAKTTFLSDTEIDFITDSEVPIGVCRVTFDVIYQTDAPIEQPNLDAWERYHAETKVVGSTDDTEPMVDDTELEQ